MSQNGEEVNFKKFIKEFWTHYKKPIKILSGSIGFFAGVLGILSYFGVKSDDISSGITSFIKEYSSFLTLLLIIIFIITVILIYIEIYKNKKAKKSGVPLTKISIAVFFAFICLIIMSSLVISSRDIDLTNIDPPINIGIVYNSNTLGKNVFEDYVDDEFKKIKGRAGVEINLMYHDLYNQRNIFNEIDTFAINNRIKYLIISSRVDHEPVDKILSRDKSKFLTIKLPPIDIPLEYKDNVVAMYYAASREVSAILSFFHDKGIRDIILIHPDTKHMSEYEKEFKSSLRINAAHHDIDISHHPVSEIDEVQSEIERFIQKKSPIPPIVLLSDHPDINSLLANYSELVPYLICSSNTYNQKSYGFFNGIDIYLPLPWPQKITPSLPHRYNLVVSAVESVTQLDKLLDKSAVRNNRETIRNSLFENYHQFALKTTQQLFGQTRLTKTNYPHFIVDDLEIIKID